MISSLFSEVPWRCSSVNDLVVFISSAIVLVLTEVIRGLYLMSNKVSVWFLVRPSQIYQTSLPVMLQLMRFRSSNVLLILKMLEK